MTVEQAAVICRATTSLELVSGASPHDRDRAVAFLVEQCSTLDPRGLAKHAERLVETLTSRPSTRPPVPARRRHPPPSDVGHLSK